MTRSAADLPDLTASQLIPLYRRKQLSPVEVARAVLGRIHALNPKFNAFCVIGGDETLAAARESEARWQKGAPLSAVDGVPATIKDLVLTRGWPTLRGSRTIDPNQRWDDDAPAVARLREAGAVLVGKTTTPEFGWKGVCDSPLTGITRNPWNPEMTSGGSSGGAGVAAAMGLGALHLGTDGGGSIRIPAGFCGIFGLKPSFGRVPAWPLSPFGTVAHLGPVTASVEDAARMLSVIGQPDDRDWHALPAPERDYVVGLDAGVARLRMGLSLDLGYVQVDPRVRELVRQAAQRFVELGAVVEDADPGFADPLKVFAHHWHSGAAFLRRGIPSDKHALIDPGFHQFADLGEAVPHLDYLQSMDARGQLGVLMNRYHRRYDVLLTPTLPIVAFEAGRIAPKEYENTWTTWAPFSFPFNLTQQPAASIPCGFVDGLPVGLQIVGPKYRDDLVLRVARAFESACPIERPPARRG